VRVLASTSEGDTPTEAEPPMVNRATEQFVSTVPGQEEVISSEGEPLHGVIALLSFLGVLETGYLTILKLTQSAPALCSSLSTGSCESVLSSKYSELFNIPLPTFGMLTYGGICALAVLGAVAKKEEKKYDNSALLGAATIAATTSLYLMLTLATKLEGQSCLYCYTSAALSASIFLATLPGWKEKDWPSGMATSLAVSVALAFGWGDLSNISVYNAAPQPQVAQAAEAAKPEFYPYYEPQVDTESTPEWVALARHLKDTGAKMYGAFWCSHCLDQKLLFGAEAVKEMPYVECFPNGFERGNVQMADACTAANLQGFPTWEIDGKRLEGDLTFKQLAKASNFK